MLDFDEISSNCSADWHSGEGAGEQQVLELFLEADLAFGSKFKCQFKFPGLIADELTPLAPTQEAVPARGTEAELLQRDLLSMFQAFGGQSGLQAACLEWSGRFFRHTVKSLSLSGDLRCLFLFDRFLALHGGLQAGFLQKQLGYLKDWHRAPAVASAVTSLR